MKRIYIKSSELKSVGYSEEFKLLDAEFKSGDIYRYFDVPKELYEGLMAAPSHGQYFNMYIRNAGFDYLKINDIEV